MSTYLVEHEHLAPLNPHDRLCPPSEHKLSLANALFPQGIQLLALKQVDPDPQDVSWSREEAGAEQHVQHLCDCRWCGVV